ncbi:hypothetical protein CSUI_002012 [Cystoisospora suis]|uniref:Arginine n-methyltransferase n=1 Tax=Cystoisospora suis TaxID=483139 RepID=A0A2C6KJ99_9APIC|nr:hypothetical protein CSUI_002012 [Cystoisospora suis]
MSVGSIIMRRRAPSLGGDGRRNVSSLAPPRGRSVPPPLSCSDRARRHLRSSTSSVKNPSSLPSSSGNSRLSSREGEKRINSSSRFRQCKADSYSSSREGSRSLLRDDPFRRAVLRKRGVKNVDSSPHLQDTRRRSGLRRGSSTSFTRVSEGCHNDDISLDDQRLEKKVQQRTRRRRGLGSSHSHSSPSSLPSLSTAHAASSSDGSSSSSSSDPTSSDEGENFSKSKNFLSPAVDESSLSLKTKSTTSCDLGSEKGLDSCCRGNSGGSTVRLPVITAPKRRSAYGPNMSVHDKIDFLIRSGVCTPTLVNNTEEVHTLSICGQFAGENHEAMIRDADRVRQYQQAISWRESPSNPGKPFVSGRRVLEIGTGPMCLLSFNAAFSGASSVFAVEASLPSYERAKRLVKVLGADETIDVVYGHSKAIPEEAFRMKEPEIVIHEILGDFASQEGVADVLYDLHRKLGYRPRSIPYVAESLICPVAFPEPSHFLYPARDYPERTIVSPSRVLLQSVKLRFNTLNLSDEMKAFECLRFEEDLEPQLDQQRILSFTIRRDDYLAGLLACIRVEIFPGHYFGTFRCGETDSWYTSIILLPEEVWVCEGDIVEVYTRSDMRNYQTATVSTSSYYYRLKKKRDENTKSQSQNPSPTKNMNDSKKRISSLPSTSSVSTAASSQTEEEEKILHLHDENKSEKKSSGEVKLERLETDHMMNEKHENSVYSKIQGDGENQKTPKSFMFSVKERQKEEDREKQRKRRNSVEILSGDGEDNSSENDQHLTIRHNDRSYRKGRACRRCGDRNNDLRATEILKEERQEEKEEETKKEEEQYRRFGSRPKHSKNAKTNTKPPHIISIISDSEEDEGGNSREDEEDNEVLSRSVPSGGKEKPHGKGSPSFISSASCCSHRMAGSTTASSNKSRKEEDEEVKEGRSGTNRRLMKEEECRKRKRQRNEENKPERKTLMCVSKPTYFFRVRIWRPLSNSVSTTRRMDGECSLSGKERLRRKKRNLKQRGNEEEEDEEERELIKEFDMIEVSYEEQAPVIAGAQRRYTSHPYGEDSLKLF